MGRILVWRYRPRYASSVASVVAVALDVVIEEFVVPLPPPLPPPEGGVTLPGPPSAKTGDAIRASTPERTNSRRDFFIGRVFLIAQTCAFMRVARFLSQRKLFLRNSLIFLAQRADKEDRASSASGALLRQVFEKMAVREKTTPLSCRLKVS